MSKNNFESEPKQFTNVDEARAHWEGVRDRAQAFLDANSDPERQKPLFLLAAYNDKLKEANKELERLSNHSVI